ncbi:MAG: hypothetical protein HYV63_17050 [Candidatus Schekmanbacteria bacterium]|nr:hypothetical protein [Candidatus Schekmanbacteria bacterium]
MMHVDRADEPPTFDIEVRAPGLRSIAEMVGEKPLRTAGRRHKQIAQARDEIPAAAFPPYWRDALHDLLSSYHRLCAYLCLYIPRGTGAPSVDHVIAKSLRWDRVYEWNNYRLACSPDGVAHAVETTITRLGLRDDICCDARAEYAEAYWDGEISLAHLTRHAPFVARELRRQGRLRPGDT